jgi:hypothetical protein
LLEDIMPNEAMPLFRDVGGRPIPTLPSLKDWPEPVMTLEQAARHFDKPAADLERWWFCTFHPYPFANFLLSPAVGAAGSEGTQFSAEAVMRHFPEMQSVARGILHRAGYVGLSALEADALILLAGARGVDPLTTRIYPCRPHQYTGGSGLITFRVSIDTMRTRARGAKNFAGFDTTRFAYHEGKLVQAKSRVHFMNGGLRCSSAASAHLQGTVGITVNWLTDQRQTLADCAEAEAMRCAFSETNGLYTIDEPYYFPVGSYFGPGSHRLN